MKSDLQIGSIPFEGVYTAGPCVALRALPTWRSAAPAAKGSNQQNRSHQPKALTSRHCSIQPQALTFLI